MNVTYIKLNESYLYIAFTKEYTLRYLLGSPYNIISQFHHYFLSLTASSKVLTCHVFQSPRNSKFVNIARPDAAERI